MKRTWAAALGVLALAGCWSRQEAGPPPVRYGEQICAECRMLVTEARFAASARTAEGPALRFDDAGCLVRYGLKHPGTLTERWVHDYRGETWRKAESALYVLDTRRPTPMGSGVVAVADAGLARQLADGGGRILNFEELTRIIRDGSPTENRP